MPQNLGSYTAMISRSSLVICALRSLRVLLITMFAVLMSACSSDFSLKPSDARQMRIAIESIHWGTPWHVTVTLPEGYDAANEGRYALLLHFAFDQESYEWTREVVDEFNAGEGQHNIILASLDYFDGSAEVGDEHASENANKTLAHIEDAVLPFLREEYRVDGNVIFAGWSRFGRFATHALERKPELFDAAIIISSAPNDSDLHDRVRKMLESKPQLKLFVYHSIGTEGSEAKVLDSPINEDQAFFPNQSMGGDIFYFSLSSFQNFYASNEGNDFSKIEPVGPEFGVHAFMASSQDYIVLNARHQEDEGRNDNDI